MARPVYDSGALIAAERDNRRMWERHAASVARREFPIVPTPVLAQVWRRGARQVRLRFLLRACEIEAFTEERAEATGELLGVSHTADIVDGSVVECAARSSAAIVTGDRADIEHLLQAASIDVVVDEI
jgi:hypothetical protein